MKSSVRIVLFMLFLGLLLFFAPRISGVSEANLTLLTVSTLDNDTFGGTADLHLAMSPGTGNVYLATFPFSKLDTQISTRFANEIACSYAKRDCSRYDFFYTIRADSSIIGGPSAGAAITALTVALLDNLPIANDIAITGTINAGGIVGPVGGTFEKVTAAKDAGLKRVIIPRWDGGLNSTLNATNVTNKSYPLGIAVIKVSTLDEILFSLTGEYYDTVISTLEVPDEYILLMKEVALQLCNRSYTLLESVDNTRGNNTLFNSSAEFLLNAGAAEASESYYSQASYCFSANLRLRELQLSNFSDDRLSEIGSDVQIAIDENLARLHEQKLRTFTDLQTKAIVDERLREAATYLEDDNLTAQTLAYAVERYRSAIIWGNFFALPGEYLQLDEVHIKDACEQKLSEVEERRGYLNYLFEFLSFENEELSVAYDMYFDGNYALCLFKASKAKAEVDMIISSISIGDGDLSSMTDERLVAAKRVIHRENMHDRFPIMGYSYYEYADSLKEDDPYVAALFASYALELGDLSLYFSPPPSFGETLFFVFSSPFVIGLFAGVLLTIILFFRIPVKKKRSKKKRF